MTDVLDPRKLADKYVEKLKSAESEAKRLLRTSNNLAKQQAEQDQKREALESQLHTTQQTIARLESEREGLKGSFVEAQFEGNAQEQREIAKRRGAIDTELEKHREDEHNLCESLEVLEPLDRQAATVAVDLDAIRTGNALAFLEELRRALIKYESEVNSTIADARKKLPAFSYETLEAVRMEDDEYREKRQREIDERERFKARQKAQQESKRYERKARTENGVVTSFDVYRDGVHIGNEPAKWVAVS